MNRWWGSKDESEKQAGDRAQRAARRTINNLQLALSDDDEYTECNTSFNNSSLFNLDGAGDIDSEDSENETEIMPLTAAESRSKR